LKIAICLSGQPRSIEFAAKSILKYYSNGEHEYDFFCHVWDYNVWKLQNIGYSDVEPVDRMWLTDKLSVYNPKKFLIESAEDLNKINGPKHIPYGSLTYSYMMANHLKRLYEFENNFRYDYVVKARYDNVFLPSTPIFPETVEQRSLFFPHLGRIPFEYNKLNPSDCIFFGDSWGMDIAADFYRYLRKLAYTPFRIDDPNITGPGTTMFEYATSYNIHLRATHTNVQEIFYRKEALGLDSINDINEIHKIHASFYTQL
jgi:hypothetical protein